MARILWQLGQPLPPVAQVQPTARRPPGPQGHVGGRPRGATLQSPDHARAQPSRSLVPRPGRRVPLLQPTQQREGPRSPRRQGTR